MDELRFTAPARRRPARRGLAQLSAFMLVQVVITGLRWGIAWSAGCVAVCALLVWVGSTLNPRAETTVGAAGITTRWFSRDRPIGWHEVRWIGPHVAKGPAGDSVIIRVTRANGRPRTLPVPTKNALYPDPEFEAKLAQIQAWWHLCTDESSRIAPAVRERPARRWRGVLPGVLAVLGLVGVVVAGCHLPSALDAADRYRALPLCARPADGVVVPTPGCVGREPLVVAAVHRQAGWLSDATIDISWPTDPGTTLPLSFNALPPGLRDLRPGDTVLGTLSPDDLYTELSAGPVTAHSEFSPTSAVGGFQAELIALSVLTLFFTAWCLAARRSPPGRRPWGVPLTAPGAFMAVVVSNHFATTEGPLDLSLYLVPAALLALGLALATGLEWQRTRRRTARHGIPPWQDTRPNPLTLGDPT